MVLEYDDSNAIVNRYVHGSDMKADDPLVWYEGSSTAGSNICNLNADASQKWANEIKVIDAQQSLAISHRFGPISSPGSQTGGVAFACGIAPLPAAGEGTSKCPATSAETHCSWPLPARRCLRA
jgi:hypothetical protein